MSANVASAFAAPAQLNPAGVQVVTLMPGADENDVEVQDQLRRRVGPSPHHMPSPSPVVPLQATGPVTRSGARRASLQTTAPTAAEVELRAEVMNQRAAIALINGRVDQMGGALESVRSEAAQTGAAVRELLATNNNMLAEFRRERTPQRTPMRVPHPQQAGRVTAEDGVSVHDSDSLYGPPQSNDGMPRAHVHVHRGPMDVRALDMQAVAAAFAQEFAKQRDGGSHLSPEERFVRQMIRGNPQVVHRKPILPRSECKCGGDPKRMPGRGMIKEKRVKKWGMCKHCHVFSAGCNCGLCGRCMRGHDSDSDSDSDADNE